ncbi:hypothetical protein KY285_030633 [Solanum tuberosum]|nr:hypothetical protein KY285_030633 [Solanum tuberosum]
MAPVSGERRKVKLLLSPSSSSESLQAGHCLVAAQRNFGSEVVSKLVTVWSLPRESLSPCKTLLLYFVVYHPVYVKLEERHRHPVLNVGALRYRNMNNLECGWMYERLDGRGAINSSFITGVDKFIQFACTQQDRLSGDKHQGEKDVINEISSSQDLHGSAQPELTYDNPYRQMVLDVSCPNFSQGSSWQSSSNIEPQPTHPCEPLMEEDPNPDSQKLYDLLQAATQKLYPGSNYGMARGRGRGKSFGRSSPAIHVSMPTIPMPTTVSPQQGGTTTVETSAQSTTPTISETPPVTPNQSNPIGQGLSTQSIPTGCSNPIAEVDLSTQSNSRGHTNTVDTDSSSNHSRTLIFISSAGLEPSIICSSFITKSFRNDVDPNGINWKSVSNDVKDGYFGEFKKKFYWDVSISESEVKRHWLVKAAIKYRNFISKIKGGGVRPGFVPEHVWERWTQLWGSNESKKKSETNAKNHRGGREAAAGTHTGGSISIGEHRKKLAIEKGRDPTPSELHLHVHTHGHDGKSFVGERSRIVHSRVCFSLVRCSYFTGLVGCESRGSVMKSEIIFYRKT